jgi:hypothetical protein
MMATLFEAYPTDDLARQAVEALRAAGVPGRDIRLLTGDQMHDIRQEPKGGFAGVVPPEAPVGTFAGVRLQRRQGAGSFAGDPDRQRQGTFADVDRDLVVTYEHGSGHTRVTGDLAIRDFLREAALGEEAVERVVAEIHAGHAVVVAETPEIAASDAKARLEAARAG